MKLALSALVVAGAATTLALQHQAQRQLRNQNESLNQQVAQLNSENTEFSNRLASSSDSGSLSKEQKDELLRLRGEVGALRAQTNLLAQLRDENRQLREAFTTLAQEHQRAAEPNAEQQQAYATQEITFAKQFVLGMLMYANDHNDQSPTNFDQASAYFEGDFVRTNQSRFEMTYQGPWKNLTSPSSTIVVRETQAWLRNGKWLKAYGFGDGHAELHTEPNGNFDDYEKERIVSLRQ
jgi:myosin heavy subunit